MRLLVPPRRYGRGSMTLGAGIELVTLRAIGLGRTSMTPIYGEPLPT